jgi:hypothetical protein
MYSLMRLENTHSYRFCPLEAVECRVLHRNLHDIRTDGEKSCQEAQKAPYNHPVHPHYHDKYSPSRKQHNHVADRLGYESRACLKNCRSLALVYTFKRNAAIQKPNT